MKFLIEGEEEIGSENLGRFLEKYQDMMSADSIVLSDTANFDTGVPALTYQLRGICQVDVEVKCLDHPLHSGMWGGPVPDPVQVLCALIADLTAKDGKLNIPGLYEDVAKPTGKQLKRIRALPFDEKKFKQRGRAWSKGVKLAGEKGYSVYERLWTRPSLTVIAIESHPIQGSSNQIVDSARARLSLRTVPNIDGKKAGALLVKKLTKKPALRRAGERAHGHRHHALVDDRPRRARLRGRAARAEGRLRQGDRHDRRRRLHRLRAAVRRPAGRRALPAHGRRGPALQRALREREPAPGRLAQVHARRPSTSTTSCRG